MMTTSADAVVVGAGLLGCATAFALLERDAGRVALVEREAPGAGDSGLSFSMVRRHYTNEVLVRLAVSGSRTIIHWPDEVGVGSSGYVRTGYLLPVPERLAARCAELCALGRTCDLDTRFIGPDEIAPVEPLLALDGIAGAAYEPDGGFADVHAMLGGWFAASVARGLDARLHTTVHAIELDDQGVCAVATSRGRIATRAVVLATGAWGTELAAPLGLELPIALRRLQVAVLRQPPGAPRPSAVVSDAVTNVVVRPAGGRDFCAVAYHGQEDVPRRDACDEGVDAPYEGTVRAALRERFPSLAEAQWVGGWAGTYDHTPDWHPVVGPAPGIEGLWLTLGWSGHGFKSAPAVGRVLADLVLGQEPEIDVADLAADRFARNRLMPLAYGPGARA